MRKRLAPSENPIGLRHVAGWRAGPFRLGGEVGDRVVLPANTCHTVADRLALAPLGRLGSTGDRYRGEHFVLRCHPEVVSAIRTAAGSPHVVPSGALVGSCIRAAVARFPIPIHRSQAFACGCNPSLQDRSLVARVSCRDGDVDYLEDAGPEHISPRIMHGRIWARHYPRAA